MKLKKLIALGLATVMSASMLVGCGSKAESDAPAADNCSCDKRRQLQLRQLFHPHPEIS